LRLFQGEWGRLCGGLQVRRLLADHTTLLDMAVHHGQKNFVAHPFTQEYLKELWFGQLKGVYGLPLYIAILQYAAFPFLLPCESCRHCRREGNRCPARGSSLSV
jgi:hypothetical protein